MHANDIPRTSIANIKFSVPGSGSGVVGATVVVVDILAIAIDSTGFYALRFHSIYK